MTNPAGPPGLREFVLRSAAIVEDLFGVSLTEAERDSLSEILASVWTEEPEGMGELQRRLQEILPGTAPMSPDSRRDMMAAFAGLPRLREAREYVQWLSAVVMRRAEE